ncbi:MAG: hypothetical protein GYB32_12065 [Algicola sp.]|nr:hypothetical protein [Algicola sp.]
MNSEKLLDCERSRLERWSKFQLSHVWKKRGVFIAFTLFAGLLVLKLVDHEPEWMRAMLKRGLLVGFLLISLARDKDEDEMIASLRGKSYALAFICAVLYALIQPAVNYLVNLVIVDSNVKDSFSYFQVLWFMLLVQIMFFEVLKRNR